MKNVIIFPNIEGTVAEREPPGPQPPERLERDLAEFRRLAGRLEFWEDQLRKWPYRTSDSEVVQIARDFHTGKFERLKIRADSALRPATSGEIAYYLGIMIACMAGRKVDSETYAVAAHEDVCAASPTVGAVEAACRKIRRSSTFLPDVATILAAVSEAECAYAASARALRAFPGIVAGIDDLIAKAAVRRAEIEAEQMRERKVAYRGLVERGADLSKRPFDKELLAEVRAEMIAEGWTPAPADDAKPDPA